MALRTGGEYKFLISKGILHINQISAGVSPMHIVHAYLLGMVKKPLAKLIFEADESQMTALAESLIGSAVLGGYCKMIQQEPPKFEFLKGSVTVVPATADDFKRAQDTGKIAYNSFYEYQTAGLYED